MPSIGQSQTLNCLLQPWSCIDLSVKTARMKASTKVDGQSETVCPHGILYPTIRNGGIGRYKNYHYQVNVYQNMINSHLYLLPLHTNFIYNMMDSSINRIRVVLAEQNKTNRWLAEQMGKSEITISRWVQNKSQPSLEQLLQVAKLLSISPKDLINDINNSEAENV